jgi:hypothetical protein
MGQGLNPCPNTIGSIRGRMNPCPFDLDKLLPLFACVIPQFILMLLRSGFLPYILVVSKASFGSPPYCFFKTYERNKILNSLKTLSFFVPTKARTSSTIIQKIYTKVISSRHLGKTN